jgi:hypothetical protein
MHYVHCHQHKYQMSHQISIKTSLQYKPFSVMWPIPYQVHAWELDTNNTGWENI